jgi:hypothetical protein
LLGAKRAGCSYFAFVFRSNFARFSFMFLSKSHIDLCSEQSSLLNIYQLPFDCDAGTLKAPALA